MIRKAKREKKWSNNADFLALIKFKKLGTNESKAIPTLRDDRQHLWFSKYQHMPDPVDPRLGIPTLLEEEVGDGDQEVDGEVDGVDGDNAAVAELDGESHDAFYDI